MGRYGCIVQVRVDSNDKEGWDLQGFNFDEFCLFGSVDVGEGKRSHLRNFKIGEFCLFGNAIQAFSFITCLHRDTIPILNALAQAYLRISLVT